MRSTRSKSKVKVAPSSTSQSIMIITVFPVKLGFSLIGRSYLKHTFLKNEKMNELLELNEWVDGWMNEWCPKDRSIYE